MTEKFLAANKTPLKYGYHIVIESKPNCVTTKIIENGNRVLIQNQFASLDRLCFGLFEKKAQGRENSSPKKITQNSSKKLKFFLEKSGQITTNIDQTKGENTV